MVSWWKKQAPRSVNYVHNSVTFMLIPVNYMHSLVIQVSKFIGKLTILNLHRIEVLNLPYANPWQSASIIREDVAIVEVRSPEGTVPPLWFHGRAWFLVPSIHLYSCPRCENIMVLVPLCHIH